VSATVCSVSAKSAGEPVSAAAVPLATAMAVFAASAARTLSALSAPSGVLAGGRRADTRPSSPEPATGDRAMSSARSGGLDVRDDQRPEER
jgi:hypothetical protein